MNPILVALTALLAACGSCGSNADAIASARSLSQPRLAQLFRDLQALDTHSGSIASISTHAYICRVAQTTRYF